MLTYRYFEMFSYFFTLSLLLAATVSSAAAEASPLDCAELLARRELYFEVREVDARSYDEEAEVRRVSMLAARHMSGLAGAATFALHNETLRFDVAVDREYRRRGVYRELMKEVLRSHPQVRRIPARMRYRTSDSAGLFYEKVFGEFSEYLDWMNSSDRWEARSQAELVDFRRRVIEALYATPAYRVRRKLGFARLTRLKLLTIDGFFKKEPSREAITLMVDGIEFDVAKGPALPSNEVEVIIQTRFREKPYLKGEPLLIAPDGELVSIKDTENLVVGDYDLIPVADWEKYKALRELHGE